MIITEADPKGRPKRIPRFAKLQPTLTEGPFQPACVVRCVRIKEGRAVFDVSKGKSRKRITIGEKEEKTLVFEGSLVTLSPKEWLAP